MKRLLLSCLFFIAAYQVFDVCVDGFYTHKVYLHTWPKQPYEALGCQYSVQEIQNVLSQPFTYLGKGRQFFVFASLDGKYVLKFIKCQRIDLPGIYKEVWLPPFLDRARREKVAQRQQRIESVFASIAFAATKLAENTGVVFAHLHTDPEVQREVLLIDKLGLRHTFCLDKVPFVVQRRAQPVMEVLAEATAEQKEIRYRQLVELIQSDARHHIYDKDDGMVERNNVGFLEDRAIHIDIGTLEHTDIDRTEEQLARFRPGVRKTRDFATQ